MDKSLYYGEDSVTQAALAGLRGYFAGKGKRYVIHSYGCQMNEHESEKIAGILREIGFEPAADGEKPDMILFNTCCVRERAEVKVFGNVGALRAAKEENPDLLVGVCGCMMQQEDIAEKLQKQYPFVDLIFGTNAIHVFPSLLWGAVSAKSRDIYRGGEEIAEGIPAIRKEGCVAFVNIMMGCDNFCSYCIVPYVRGRERSRKPQDILDEVHRLADEGIREITLLGQNVNSYGRGHENDMRFSELLYKIAQTEGLLRVRFMTSHPKDLTDDLIEAFPAIPKLARHIHLPVQAGSDRILRAMNRHYTAEHYTGLVERLREAVPGLAVTTDMIVGFPGETDEDFEQTLALVRRVRFNAAFTFQYSLRKGTAAADMPNKISVAVKKERLARLNAVVNEIALEKLAENVGQTHDVLVEKVSPRSQRQVCGRTSSGVMVNMEGTAKLVGQIIPARMTAAKAHTLSGLRIEEE